MDETPATASRGPAIRRFVWHYAQMVIAMMIGMMVLGPLWRLAAAPLGWSDTLARADVGALVMATDMAVAMALWMRFRRHTWISIAEMSAAMYLPFVVLLVPLWMGLISGGVLHTAGHVLMLPCMLLAMLWRRDEYTRHHRHRTQRPDSATVAPQQKTSEPSTTGD